MNALARSVMFILATLKSHSWNTVKTIPISHAGDFTVEREWVSFYRSDKAFSLSASAIRPRHCFVVSFPSPFCCRSLSTNVRLSRWNEQLNSPIKLGMSGWSSLSDFVYLCFEPVPHNGGLLCWAFFSRARGPKTRTSRIRCYYRNVFDDYE